MLQPRPSTQPCHRRTRGQGPGSMPSIRGPCRQRGRRRLPSKAARSPRRSPPPPLDHRHRLRSRRVTPRAIPRRRRRGAGNRGQGTGDRRTSRPRRPRPLCSRGQGAAGARGRPCSRRCSPPALAVPRRATTTTASRLRPAAEAPPTRLGGGQGPGATLVGRALVRIPGVAWGLSLAEPLRGSSAWGLSGLTSPGPPPHQHQHQH